MPTRLWWPTPLPEHTGRLGDEVFFLTGTDEHGQKVERAAQKAGLGTQAFADQVAQKFADLLPMLEYLRTTTSSGPPNPGTTAAAQALWRRVRDRGRLHLQGQIRGLVLHGR